MPEASPMPWPSWTSPYAIELKFQLLAADVAFKSLESRIADRKAIFSEIAGELKAGGPPPIKVEQEAFRRKVQKSANLAGPILGDVQSFLAAVGVVESILWPSEAHYRDETAADRAARIERGKTIRNLLRVPDGSPLETTTRGEDDARGGMLHFDEMIDEMVRGRGAQGNVSLEIGSAERGTATRRDEAIRWLDEDTLELWVGGRHRNLRDVHKALFDTLKFETCGELSFSRSAGPPSAKPPPPSLAFGADLKPK